MDLYAFQEPEKEGLSRSSVSWREKSSIEALNFKKEESLHARRHEFQGIHGFVE